MTHDPFNDADLPPVDELARSYGDDTAFAAAWTATVPAPVEARTPEFLEALRGRIVGEERLEGRERRLGNRLGLELGKRPLRKNSAYAASLLVAGAIAVAMIAVNKVTWNGARTPSFVQTYTTTAGQLASVTLADGSHAQLGPLTTLTVTGHPTERRIDVGVTGEVFFIVAHRRSTSFQVHTANAVTRVLGTTFLVRRYPTDYMTQVVVADGRVALSGVQRQVQGPTSILTPCMLGTVNDSGHVVVTPNITLEDYTVWTLGRLVFRDTPMRDVMAELSRAYNVEFRLADSTLAERHLTWTVPLAQQSLAGVLTVLGGVMDAHPVRAGRVITFVPGRSASPRPVDLPSSTPERQYGK